MVGQRDWRTLGGWAVWACEAALEMGCAHRSRGSVTGSVHAAWLLAARAPALGAAARARPAVWLQYLTAKCEMPCARSAGLDLQDLQDLQIAHLVDHLDCAARVDYDDRSGLDVDLRAAVAAAAVGAAGEGLLLRGLSPELGV